MVPDEIKGIIKVIFGHMGNVCTNVFDYTEQYCHSDAPNKSKRPNLHLQRQKTTELNELGRLCLLYQTEKKLTLKLHNSFTKQFFL